MITWERKEIERRSVRKIEKEEPRKGRRWAPPTTVWPRHTWNYWPCLRLEPKVGPKKETTDWYVSYYTVCKPVRQTPNKDDVPDVKKNSIASQTSVAWSQHLFTSCTKTMMYLTSLDLFNVCYMRTLCCTCTIYSYMIEEVKNQPVNWQKWNIETLISLANRSAL